MKNRIVKDYFECVPTAQLHETNSEYIYRDKATHQRLATVFKPGCYNGHTEWVAKIDASVDPSECIIVRPDVGKLLNATNQFLRKNPPGNS